MLGRDDDHARGLERAHQHHVEEGEQILAARCACWIGLNPALRGEIAQASGWFARAQRLLAAPEADCVEHGYLMIPAMMQQEAEGDFEDAYATAAGAVDLGERFRDSDLISIALHVQGRARLKQGRIGEGLPLLDEAMVAVTAGELSPIATGIVYCSVIEACQEALELARAREWTLALARWCEGQTDLVSFTGKCLMHRAEIKQASGEWHDALTETQRACSRFREDANDSAFAMTMYRQGEILRVQGELGQAEDAYARAAEGGCEPQPGLALLRLAQGDARAALAAIGRVLGETSEPLARAGLLPAFVEITLALGEIEDARGAAVELERLAEGSKNDTLLAIAAYARGAVALEERSRSPTVTRGRRSRRCTMQRGCGSSCRLRTR